MRECSDDIVLVDNFSDESRYAATVLKDFVSYLTKRRIDEGYEPIIHGIGLEVTEESTYRLTATVSV